MTAGPASSLLPAQEAHWELVRALSPGNPGHSRQIVFDCRQLNGSLDEPALMRAFAAVSERHESLRAGFIDAGTDPRICVRTGDEPPAEFMDLSGLASGARRRRAAELVFGETRRCFDLRGPLWHAWVVRLGETVHWLVVSLSHVIADGWSGKIFVDDLLADYGAQTGAGPGWTARSPALEELRQMQGARLRSLPERLRYWRERLVPLPGPSLFPAPPATADMLARSNVPFSLPGPTVAQIRALAWRARTTPFVALMAAHHLQLAIVLGKTRVVLSTAAMAGVSAAERQAICQHAADPYVSLEITDGHTVGDHVRQAHTALTGALAHMVPFTSVARTVNPRFDGHRPWADPHLFDGNFIDSAFSPAEQTSCGLLIARPELALQELQRSVRSDLIWSRLPPVSRPVWETISGPGFELNAARDGGVVHFNDQVVPEEAIRDFTGRYLWVVRKLAHAPDMTVGELRDRYGQATSDGPLPTTNEAHQAGG